MGDVFWAYESVGKHGSGFDAALTESLVGPVALASELVEVEARGALHDGGQTVDAPVVLPAVGWVFVGESTILAGALKCADWLLQVSRVAVIALIEIGLVEVHTVTFNVAVDEAIRAFVFDLSSVGIALVVDVAPSLVSEGNHGVAE